MNVLVRECVVYNDVWLFISQILTVYDLPMIDAAEYSNWQADEIAACSVNTAIWMHGVLDSFTISTSNLDIFQEEILFMSVKFGNYTSIRKEIKRKCPTFCTLDQRWPTVLLILSQCWPSVKYLASQHTNDVLQTSNQPTLSQYWRCANIKPTPMLDQRGADEQNDCGPT